MLRVRVTEKLSVYWNHQVLTLPEGEEVSGEAAIYLARTGAPVEIVEGELPPEPAEQDAVEEDATGGPHLVPGATIAEIMSWVGEDPARAKAALDAEEGREKPRATLVAKLEPLAAQANDEPGPDEGVPGDERPPAGGDQTGSGGE